MRSVWAVTSAVTLGLPSRSPPIHEPQRRKAGTRGGRAPGRPRAAAGGAGRAPGEWARPHGPEAGRAPQDGDLLAQPAADVAVFVGRQAKVVQPLEQSPTAPQGDEEGAPSRLGRGGGEDGGGGQPSDDRYRIRSG